MKGTFHSYVISHTREEERENEITRNKRIIAGFKTVKIIFVCLTKIARRVNRALV